MVRAPEASINQSVKRALPASLLAMAVIAGFNAQPTEASKKPAIQAVLEYQNEVNDADLYNFEGHNIPEVGQRAATRLATNLVNRYRVAQKEAKKDNIDPLHPGGQGGIANEVGHFTLTALSEDAQTLVLAYRSTNKSKVGEFADVQASAVMKRVGNYLDPRTTSNASLSITSYIYDSSSAANRPLELYNGSLRKVPEDKAIGWDMQTAFGVEGKPTLNIPAFDISGGTSEQAIPEPFTVSGFTNLANQMSSLSSQYINGRAADYILPANTPGMNGYSSQARRRGVE